LRTLIVAAVLALDAGTARSAELVMYETDGCPFCIRWHKEIAPIYPRTDEGKAVPLRLERLGSPKSDLRHIRNIRYAPTFVVHHCGRELGRITGYQGEDFFWGELSVILTRQSQELSKAC
jgi:thioredoxin-related protein